jgi:hypothetical protein
MENKTELIELLELLLEQGKKNPEQSLGDLLWRTGIIEYTYEDKESYENNILDPIVFTNEEMLIKIKAKIKQLK